MLVVDYPPEECVSFAATAKAGGLDPIFLLAPTSTDDRIQMICERASGFLYAVSRAGVTGTRERVSAEAEKLVSRIRAICELPIAVGFGISNAEQVREVWRYADAAVVGSAIVAEIERRGGAPDLAEAVGRLTRSLIPI